MASARRQDPMKVRLGFLPSKMGRLRGGGLRHHVHFGGMYEYVTTRDRYRSTGTPICLEITSYISIAKRSQGEVALTDLNDRV